MIEDTLSVPVSQEQTVLTCSSGCGAVKSGWIDHLTAEKKEVSELMRAFIEKETVSLSPLEGIPTAFPQPVAYQHTFFSSLASFFSWRRALPPPTLPSAILRERGFSKLAEQLDQRRGFPWEEIKRLKDPELMEQMVEISLLCDKKTTLKTRRIGRKIIQFSLRVIKYAEMFKLKREKVGVLKIHEELKQFLGQLIYLLNQDLEKTFRAIHTPLFHKAFQNIHMTFHEEMLSVCERLHLHYLNHRESGLQSAPQALQQKIALELAKALLTERGTINFGIAAVLSKIFLPSSKTALNHEIGWQRGLQLCASSFMLRDLFADVGDPSPNPLIQELLKTALSLPPSAILGKNDTKLALLSSLFSHLRQGQEGSCFAVSLAIEMLANQVADSLKELSSLLQKGKLMRKIKGIVKEIPFCLSINDEKLTAKIRILSDGTTYVEGKKCKAIWSSPGMQAACLSIGFNLNKHSMDALLKKGEEEELNIKTLLKKIAASVAQGDQKREAALFNRACFAFSAQTAPPILKAWENSIATMAESVEEGMIKKSIQKAVVDSLQYRLSTNKIPPSPALQRLFLQIQKNLHQSIELRYDPCIFSAPHLSHQKIEGGFVLYVKEQRVDTFEKFRAFVSDLLEASIRFCDQEQPGFAQAASLLTSYIQTEEWLCYLLVRYYPAGKKEVERALLKRKHEELIFTPWITKCGNNSKALIGTYLELNETIQAQVLVPKNGKEALLFLIDMYKKKTFQEKNLLARQPHFLAPFCILGKHRLSLMAGHPSFLPAWTSTKDTETWIAEHVLRPGIEIAAQSMSSSVRTLLEETLVQHPFFKNLTPKQLQDLYEQLKKIQTPVSYREYRQAVIRNIEKGALCTPSQIKKWTTELDQLLFNTLDPSRKSLLEQSAISFADTNWCEELQDLHFCFVVNPGTGELELWQRHADGTHLAPLDQDYWLNNQRWEFPILPKKTLQGD